MLHYTFFVPNMVSFVSLLITLFISLGEAAASDRTRLAETRSSSSAQHFSVPKPCVGGDSLVVEASQQNAFDSRERRRRWSRLLPQLVLALQSQHHLAGQENTRWENLDPQFVGQRRADHLFARWQFNVTLSWQIDPQVEWVARSGRIPSRDTIASARLLQLCRAYRKLLLMAEHSTPMQARIRSIVDLERLKVFIGILASENKATRPRRDP